jgi:hypothetical protein
MNIDLRIVPTKPAIMFRGIVAGRLVKDLAFIRQRTLRTRKAFRDIYIMRQFSSTSSTATHFFAGGGAFTDVHGHVEDLSAQTPHQLADGGRAELIVQPPQDLTA